MTAPQQRRILDSHVHVWPNAQPGRPYPWPSAPDPHPAEALLPVLDKAGVAAAIQVTPSTLGFDNTYGIVETSSEPFPFRDVHDHLARAHALFGAERLIWGSNYPVVLNTCSYAESLEFVYECDFFSDDDLDQVLAGTFDALTAEGNGCASPS